MDRAVRAIYRVIGANPSVLLAAMLALLYLVMRQPPDSNFAKALFVAHMGLFIVWQPVVEGQQRMSAMATSWLLLLMLGMTLTFDGWLVVVWTMMLAATVGGRVLLAGSARLRLAYLVALGFLVLTLLLLAVPAAFDAIDLPPPFVALGDVVLPVVLVLIAVLPARARDDTSEEVVDFVNSLLVFLLLAVLVLASLAQIVVFQATYARALLQSLAVLGSVLLFLGWIWNPHLGFGGLESFLSRYLTSIGMPAERWLQALTNLAVRETDPAEFVAAGCREMAQRLPWVRGVDWRVHGASGAAGEAAGHRSEFAHQEVTVGIFTRYPLPPSLIWNVNLFIELLAEFHADKRRAQRLREMSYLQAVHETGARLTHDVKNLLQSLQTLVFAVEQADAADAAEFQGLIRRQLPAIATRLSVTLDKLRVPVPSEDERAMRFTAWWAAVFRRYQHLAWLRMVTESPPELTEVPAAAFFSVLDNLIANVEQKRAGEPRVTAYLTARANSRGLEITLRDDGMALPSAVAAQLFLHPLRSENGLGIGLYQSAQLARQCGYELMLDSNADGAVVFALRTRSTA